MKIKQESLQRCSGQVAVRVLLSIHSLQVLFLYQDVDAFLSTTGRQMRFSSQTAVGGLTSGLVGYLNDRNSGFKSG